LSISGKKKLEEEKDNSGGTNVEKRLKGGGENGLKRNSAGRKRKTRRGEITARQEFFWLFLMSEGLQGGSTQENAG